MSGWTIGIVGGSGLYDIAGLSGEWVTVETPWGAPSDTILRGSVGGVGVAFLPRHGRGHRIPPGAINARANIAALKMLGCTDVIAISSVGSLAEDRPPGSFTIVDQIVDRTRGRPASFFGDGLVAHVSMADPTCARLSAMLSAAMPGARAGGTYLAMEGPAFSTRAESRLYRSWGCDVIGMTAMPEAVLAREAELPYALVGMVTDYDSWREGEAVDVSAVLAQVGRNTAAARGLVERLLDALPAERAASWIDTNLDAAIITPPGARDAGVVERLRCVAKRALS